MEPRVSFLSLIGATASLAFSVSDLSSTSPLPRTVQVSKAEAVSNVDLELEIRKEIERSQAEYLNFGTEEQLAEDDRAWREKLAATTPEQLARLERMALEEEREGTFPLDFTGK